MDSPAISLPGPYQQVSMNSADRTWTTDAPAMPLPQSCRRMSISPCRQGIQIYMDESCATRKPVARIQRNLLGTRYTVELDPSVKPWRADSVARPHGAGPSPDGSSVGAQARHSCTLAVPASSRPASRLAKSGKRTLRHCVS